MLPRIEARACVFRRIKYVSCTAARFGLAPRILSALARLTVTPIGCQPDSDAHRVRHWHVYLAQVQDTLQANRTTDCGGKDAIDAFLRTGAGSQQHICSDIEVPDPGRRTQKQTKPRPGWEQPAKRHVSRACHNRETVPPKCTKAAVQ